MILPAYNEEASIGATIDRIAEAQRLAPDLLDDLDVIVVSDGSTDQTVAAATDRLRGHLSGTVIDLSTNVGSHAAIRCGLAAARGDLLVVLAADGQDPPEMLADIVAAFTPGVEVVWGRRKSRSHDPFLTRQLANLYYRLFRMLTGLHYPTSGIDVMAISRRASEIVQAYGERNAPVFLLVFNLGLRDAFVEYDRGERLAGESGWSLRKRVRLAVDMLTSFSAAPIRMLSLVGVLVGAAGLLFGTITLIRGLLGRIPVSGWASLMVVSSLMSGITLLAIGFLGEYVWRTLDEVRNRPLFIESSRTVVHFPGNEPD